MEKLNGTILIIEDDEDVLFTARAVLRKRFETILCASNPSEVPGLFKTHTIDVVLLDMNFRAGETSGKEGLHWLERIVKLDPEVKVLMVTAYGDIQLAVKSMKLGATDFLVKPWEREKLVATVVSAFRLKDTQKQLQNYRRAQKFFFSEEEMIGESPAMKTVFDQVDKVAGTDANVLILGENGTGKDLLAGIIHQKSRRKDFPFVKVDLGAVAETLFESELFGHVKGAFTDAKEDKPGRFEIASGGTLFLDEIGNLPPTLQAKLLTAIQSGRIHRVGSEKELTTDVRLICATNQPIYELIEQGAFRQDLLYRINTLEITMPPLRERAEDIGLLAAHFFDQYREKYNKGSLKLPDKTLNWLQKYSWPGNVRELKHAMERAVIMCDTNQLTPEDFALKAPKIRKKTNLNVEEMEKEAIVKALEKCKGHMTLVAKELGLSRSTLYRKIKKYDIQ